MVIDVEESGLHDPKHEMRGTGWWRNDYEALLGVMINFSARASEYRFVSKGSDQSLWYVVSFLSCGPIGLNSNSLLCRQIPSVTSTGDSDDLDFGPEFRLEFRFLVRV